MNETKKQQQFTQMFVFLITFDIFFDYLRERKRERGEIIKANLNFGKNINFSLWIYM
jgi:hypothetical protein